MKKSILLVGMALVFCLIAGTAMADTDNNKMGQPSMNGQMQGQPPMGGPQMNNGQGGQMQGQPPMGGSQMNNGQGGQMQGQPPMGGSQMNGGQGGQMQGQPPMNLAAINDDDAESISLFTEADSDSEVLGSIENGTVAEVLEEDGDYTKVNIKGTIGYVLTSLLSELAPEDGQEPPAKPEDGQEPPAKPEDGQEPPAKPEDGQEPPAKPEDGQEPPAKPEDGQEPPAKPEDGQEPPAMPENRQQTSGQPGGQMMNAQPAMDGAGQQSNSLEPGIQNFFKAFLNYLTGNNTAN